MAQETTKQKATKKETEKPKVKPLIYLGPDVATEEAHLNYGMVFMNRPELPDKLKFLEEWFFEIDKPKDLQAKRREIKTPGSELFKKWMETRKKIIEIRRKKEGKQD